MEIVTKVPLWQVVEKEIRRGFELQRATEAAREREAAQSVKEADKKIVGKGGMELRKIASIPARDFFQIRNKYGVEALHDDEFLGDFKRHNPHLATIYCPDRKRLKSVA